MTYSPQLVFVTPASFRRPREPSLNAFGSQVTTSWLLKGTIAPSAFDRHGRPPLGWWRHLDGRRKLPTPEPLYRPGDLEENVRVGSLAEVAGCPKVGPLYT